MEPEAYKPEGSEKWFLICRSKVHGSLVMCSGGIWKCVQEFTVSEMEKKSQTPNLEYTVFSTHDEAEAKQLAKSMLGLYKN